MEEQALRNNNIATHELSAPRSPPGGNGHIIQEAPALPLSLSCY